MSTDAPRFHRQFRRIESRYQGAVNSGWYRADLGNVAPFIKVPVWVYSTWAPFEVNLIGSSSDEYVALVDNTYVSSFAYNLAKIQLGSELFPDHDDYADLLVGNLKKFIAEQHYYITRSHQSMMSIIEYLIEYNGRNRTLDTAFHQRPDGKALLHLLASSATYSLITHEVGHIAYGVSDYKLRQRQVIDRHINAVVGANHTLKRLEEEVFCDIFAVVNVMATFNRVEGWDPADLCNVCLYTLAAALMCIKTRDVVQAALNEELPPISLNPERDVLMARYEVTANAIGEALQAEQEWFQPTKRTVQFSGDKLGLRARWLDALDMPVRDPETRVLATILANAFADPSLGGFDHVMKALNQMTSLSQLADAAVQSG